MACLNASGPAATVVGVARDFAAGVFPDFLVTVVGMKMGG